MEEKNNDQIAKKHNELTQKLRYAIFTGNFAEVKKLIALGADPNGSEAVVGAYDGEVHYYKPDYMADAPLFIALYHAHNSGIAKYLIEKGAEVNRGYREGDVHRTMLMRFAELGSFEYCKFLVENGADIDIEYDLNTNYHSWRATAIFLAKNERLSGYLTGMRDMQKFYKESALTKDEKTK